MALKKDKEKVLDEVWTLDRVKEFLEVQPAANTDSDFHMLLKAYQSMRADNFEDFVGLFLEKGYNINASNDKQQTVLAIAKQHKSSIDFVNILQAHGAT